MKLTSSIRDALDRAFSPECDMSTPLTLSERFCAGLAILAPIIGVFLVMSVVGCKALYENGGSSGRVGSVTAPIEISDGTDSFTCKLLFSMDGAYWYTRKDSKVKVVYDNTYTNTYIGCINTHGKQRLEVEVEPLYVGEECETNAVPSCSSSDSSASTPSTPSATASSSASPAVE